MLHALAAKLNQCTDPTEIGEAITTELRRLIDYHNCRVFVLGVDGETLLPVAFRGELGEYQAETSDVLVTKVGRGITGHAAATHLPYSTPDAARDPFAITIPGTPEADESIMAVPLLFGERLIGVVVLSKLGIDQFDEADLRVLEIVASHAAVAVENARARAEIELALASEREVATRLKALDEMKNTFLEAVSHDLRTPLTAVMGVALTLDREDLILSPEDRRDLVRRLAFNARKLDRLLCNLLDLDRLVRGVVAPRCQPTDLAALVRTVLGEGDLLVDRHVSVDAEPLMADVDPAKVERIVENLLVNAAKHTPEGTLIWVRVAAQDGHALIIVEDEGPGVPKEIRDRIFEPFIRGTSDHPSPGVGVGLSVVARFAALHGGRAWVEDRPGGGASFRVLLPRTAPVA